MSDDRWLVEAARKVRDEYIETLQAGTRDAVLFGRGRLALRPPPLARLYPATPAGELYERVRHSRCYALLGALACTGGLHEG